jgi:hypothetical protein
MKREIRIGVVAAAIGLWSNAASAELTLTLDPSKDNSLYQSSLGSVSNGAGDYLFVGKTFRTGQLRRGAIAFDFSTLPANAMVSSVTLTLTLSAAGPTVPSDVMLHRFTENWGEGASDAGEPGGTGADALPGDATWIHAFYNTVPWSTPGGTFSPMMSAMRSVGGDALAYDFNAPQLAADVQAWLANPAMNFGWALIGDESVNGSAKKFNSRENPTASSRPKITIVYDVVAAGSTWNVDGGGAWGTATNWTGGVPDGAGARAIFAGKLTAPGAPATILLGGDRKVGQLTFDNANTYVIDSANGERLTLDNGQSAAILDVRGGTHVIRTPLRIAGWTDLNLDSRLEVHGGIAVDGGMILSMTGAGTLDVGAGTPGVGVQMNPGSRLEIAAGLLSTGNIRGGGLEIDDGRIHIKPDGTSAGTSVLDAIEFDGLGALDLSDNDLIVRATAATKGAVLDEVVARIETARDAAAGRWKGPGITSSAAEANALTGLAAMTNPGLPNFSGQGVGADDVLIKYTWNGDANLDGRVNADDYFRIDSGFLEQPQDPTYGQGDFNYDGRINADDYFLIDSAFLGQSGPLDAGVVGAIAAVPEPGAVGGLLLGSVLMATRRRRPRA